ncbi:tripartite motif-containing protein 3-like [Pomacea canaliculata]|uniref:tripartite motif-containing protein 3-like n=1 Tax=Pomacea canaliculata TaxID=400727 RepID=UPI000D72531F|nr:tripartite motif-containing protein 3-like [Pomacea canaliculata]
MSITTMMSGKLRPCHTFQSFKREGGLPTPGSETSKDREDIVPTTSTNEGEFAGLAGEAEVRDVQEDPDSIHTSHHLHRELLREHEVSRFEARLLNKIGTQDDAESGGGGDFCGGDDCDFLTNITHVCHLYKGFLALTDVLRGTVSVATPRGSVVGNLLNKPGSEPWCSCVAPNGHLVVTLRHLGCVTVWSGKGTLVREFGYGVLTCPTSIACDRRGRFVVTDDKTNMVALFTPSGQFITYLRGPGKTMTSSDMYVGLSTDNVDKFDLSSVVQSDDVNSRDATATLGTATFERNTELPNNDVDTPYVFSQPRYVCVTASGKIVVSDAGSHSLKIFDPDGNFLHAVGSYGSGDGQLKAPYGVCSDQQENIFVADYYNNRVSVFTIDGKFIQHVLTSSSGLFRPKSVAVRPTHDRKLYVAHGGLRTTEVLMYRLHEKNNGVSVALKFDF